MKNTSLGVSLFLVLGLVFIGPPVAYHYILAPRVLFKDIRKAIIYKDTIVLSQTIDFPLVKQQLTQEFQQKMIEETEKNPTAQLDLWAGEEVLHSVFEKLISPEGLISMTERSEGDTLHVPLPPNYSIGDWVKNSTIHYKDWTHLTMTVHTSPHQTLRFNLASRRGHWVIVGMSIPEPKSMPSSKNNS